MARTILSYPHPVLARKAEPVAEITPELQALADEMVETMYLNDGLGLAAPQVGECCRLVVMDVSGPKERKDLMILVNPVITRAEGETVAEEGCLSVRTYRTEVTRAEKVSVRAQDLQGNPVEFEAEGLKAVCIQHEIDHLDGILFIDRISRLKRLLFEKRIKKQEKRAREKDES